MIPELKKIIITILKDGQKTLKPLKPVLLHMLMYRDTLSFVQVAHLLNGCQDYSRTVGKDLKRGDSKYLALGFSHTAVVIQLY